MDIYSVAAIGVIGALICVLLKQYRPELALLAGCATAVLILTGAIDIMLEALEFFRELAEKSGMSALTVKTLLKCIGICMAASFASDICTDSGENALASRIETYGKIAAFSVSIPLFREFIELVISLTKM